PSVTVQRPETARRPACRGDRRETAPAPLAAPPGFADRALSAPWRMLDFAPNRRSSRRAVYPVSDADPATCPQQYFHDLRLVRASQIPAGRPLARHPRLLGNCAYRILLRRARQPHRLSRL